MTPDRLRMIASELTDIRVMGRVTGDGSYLSMAAEDLARWANELETKAVALGPIQMARPPQIAGTLRVHLAHPDLADLAGMPAHYHDFPGAAATSVGGELEVTDEQGALMARYNAFAWTRFELRP